MAVHHIECESCCAVSVVAANEGDVDRHLTNRTISQAVLSDLYMPMAYQRPAQLKSMRASVPSQYGVRCVTDTSRGCA